MYPFALVTDSTIDETAAYFSQNDIGCAPLAFTIDGRTIEEDCGQTVSFHQFYDLLREGKLPVTSQAKLETFLTLFRTALEAGQDVLYIGFSSGLSGTFHAGCMARDELAPLFPARKIICIDSLSATGGEYLLVDKAREMRDSGCTIEVTAAAVEQMCDQIELELQGHFPGCSFPFRYSPGYGDLPLELQNPLLDLLDAPRRVGLCASASHILTPRKSVTAILGAADGPIQPTVRSCLGCPARESCQYRKSGGHCGIS